MIYRRMWMLTLAMLLSIVMWASPTLKGIYRTIRLNDGTTLKVHQCGDERLGYWMADDGRMFINSNEKGEVKEVSEAEMATLREKAMLKTEFRTQNAKRKTQKALNSAQPANSFIGKRKGLIILVEFQNKEFETPDAGTFFNRVINERNFKEGRYVGSVKDYFLDQSYGQFELDFDVVGPVKVSQDYSYYGAPGNGEVDARPWEMILEACELVDDKVNFADYDWDGDGTVEQVFVLYAGKGESTSGDQNTIWPHEFELTSVHKGETFLFPEGKKFDGVTIDTYACANEVRLGGQLEGIGTICHEFAHCMGLPDTYDTYYSGNFGMGPWDVMSQGEYNGEGFTPAAFTSYERMVCGWKQPIELCSEDVTVDNMKAIADGGDFYIIRNDGCSDEYYLLENRQRTGWDKGIVAEGMLILHVDYDPGVWSENIVNSIVDDRGDDPNSKRYNSHQRLTIVHADNNDDRQASQPSWDGYVKTTEETDVYPYLGNDSLTNNSVPCADVYNRNSDGSAYLNHGVHHIHQNSDGTMGFEFKAVSQRIVTTDPTITEETNLEGAIFYESFNQCIGTGGNDGVFKGSADVASADFIADNGGWDSMEKSGGAHCAKFGNGARIGFVTSPVITLDGREMLLEFNAAPWSRDDTDLVLSVSGNATLGETQLEMAEGEWTRYSVPLKGEGNVRISFTPGKRFFLDEVVIRDAAASAISTPETLETTETLYFTLSGQLVGRGTPGRPGIYIRNGKKYIVRTKN